MEACHSLVSNRLRNWVRDHNRECRECALTAIALLVIGLITLAGLQLIQWGGIPPGQEFFYGGFKAAFVFTAALGGSALIISRIWTTCIQQKLPPQELLLPELSPQELLPRDGYHQIAERLKKELDIEDIAAREGEIYDGYPMSIRRAVPRLSIESYYRLRWLKDEEVLSLKISEIKAYSQEHIRLLLHRLYLIENKRGENYVFQQSASNNFDIENATLSGFRQLDVLKLFERLGAASPILGLLSSNQIKQLLNCKDVKITNETMDALFPLDLEHEHIRTRFLLQDLSIETIIGCFDSFSGYHLRYLSHEQLQSLQFPWEKVIQSEQKISELFDCSDDFRSQETKRILQQLNMGVIQAVVEKLSGDSLRLLSPKQLQSKEFPWEKLTSKQIKELFGCVPVTTMTDGRMFSHDSTRQNILQLLDSNVLKKLMGSLTAHHLLMLSPEQLQSGNFPWDDVGQEKIDILFSNTGGLSRTRRIWEYLDVGTLGKLQKRYTIPTLQRLLPKEKYNQLKPCK